MTAPMRIKANQIESNRTKLELEHPAFDAQDSAFFPRPKGYDAIPFFELTLKFENKFNGFCISDRIGVK